MSLSAIVLNCFYDPLTLLLAQITTAREVCVFSSKLKTFRANLIFMCKGNFLFSVDHIAGKLVSNLVINNSPEQAHTWSLSDSSLDESSAFHATSVR